ncbi:MAG: alpha-amylase [Anaerolineaceae bacterium]|nr:alpha-amylase [Anaerolineaceae bacterium]
MQKIFIKNPFRSSLGFEPDSFSFSGKLQFSNFPEVRTFTFQLNQQLDTLKSPDAIIQSSHINGMSLMDDIFSEVISIYKDQENPDMLIDLQSFLEDRIGEKKLKAGLYSFIQELPPRDVYSGIITHEDFLNPASSEQSNIPILLEELLLYWVTNQNPAFGTFSILFDDQNLMKHSEYEGIVAGFQDFFINAPVFGKDNQNLIDFLRSPAIAEPDSISGQLEYIKTRWAYLLGDFLYRILSSLDYIKEEDKRFLGAGPGPILLPDYSEFSEDEENFSQDRDWMPNLVLIAKNSYVWLDQLRKKYNRDIPTLSDIPEEEFVLMSSRGINGLWLIGLWERSQASSRIKQLCGNPDAISSAYSIRSYVIADALGGDEGYQALMNKARKYGIRLASDMVPNHMGIDSHWVMDHPDWFLSAEHSPFPSYSFTGVNLSPVDYVEVKIEDHYYDQTDAAVSFKYHNHQTGQTKHIYHGNDGTNMPWNDTAQLDYLNPEVREQVIQTIIDVARKFPIIRFDAAMTLAKKHYQRLWFPEPGTGGDIPSRSDFSLSKSNFDKAMPVEFWREVVDRIAKEAPDTLLLAEAFWMMEGYFVRTLGMHRVYNSAFMHMLRDEDNAKYRQVIKDTLEFEPEILKRFVNFMNNPDERTAIDQFGNGDKYFGVCILLSTLPGLPMFGHGQIEGFSEKYGMEYQRAYKNEVEDNNLISRHNHEIFPLLHKRYLFAEVMNFQFYDLITPNGNADDDVYVYSNRFGNESALIIYNNKFKNTQGNIQFSSQKSDHENQIKSISLGDSLGLQLAENSFIIFKDIIANLEYIREAEDFEHGLFVDLGAYKSHVFIDFRELQDDEHNTLKRLTKTLNGRGVSNMDTAQHEMVYSIVQNPFRAISGKNTLEEFSWQRNDPVFLSGFLHRANQNYKNFLISIQSLKGTQTDISSMLEVFSNDLDIISELDRLYEEHSYLPRVTLRRIQKYIDQIYNDEKKELALSILFIWANLRNIGKLENVQDHEFYSLKWFDEWKLSEIIKSNLQSLEIKLANSEIVLLNILIAHQNWRIISSKDSNQDLMKKWLHDPQIQSFIQLNKYDDHLWFNQESFEDLISWMFILALISILSTNEYTKSEKLEKIIINFQRIENFFQAKIKSEFQVDKLLENL